MIEAQKYTRRLALQRGGTLGAMMAAGWLTACGEQSGGAATAVGKQETVGGTVRTLLWEGYGDEKAFAPLLKRDVSLKQAFLAANEDVINKKGQYDIGVGIQGIFPALGQAGLLAQLDLERVPNVGKLVLPEFVSSPFIQVDDGPAGIPYVWASQGLSYLEQGGAKPAKLADLLSPRFKGKLGIGDDGIPVILMVARSLGFGGDTPTKLTQAQMDQIFDALGEYKKQARGVIANPYGEYAGAYKRGEIVAAFPDWAPTAVAARAAGKSVQFALGPESFSWVDTLFIPKGVQPTATLYAFLDQAVATQTQTVIGKTLILAPTNRDALKRLADSGPGWAPYADPAKTLAAAPNTEWPPVKSDEFVDYAAWLKRWAEFKAS